jgi:hypothetical protein
MTYLPSNLRGQLERTIVQARDVAEIAAASALENLAVHHNEPYEHMSPEERKLRKRLRLRARHLGDRLDANTGGHGIGHLTTECAYEHWNRMLFARYLAENHLLIEPENSVPISLEECEELAKDEGVDRWVLASRYAEKMLPQIFRTDDPLLELEFAKEHRLKLETLLNGLERNIFIASDSLGWVYQFWQSKRKDEVNKSGIKIGADELPAVTQLFTEPYMVSFLLDNSLGAWWANKRLNNEDLSSAKSEEELRKKASLPGVPLGYLRFVKNEDKKWTPAGGTFDEWPENLSEFKALDPCCGSGHFLVAAFLMLVPIRIELENLSARDAVDAVLRENLNGLEIDPRCVELAAFALALAAWKYPAAGGYRKLTKFNVACSGLALRGNREEWIKLAGDNNSFRIALDLIYEMFKYAPTLGSLINPLKSAAAKIVEWGELSKLIEKALDKEGGDEVNEMSVVARGLSEAIQLLAEKYHWVFTNVPYLARGKQDQELQEYLGQNYKAGKNDLATAFLSRCLEFCKEGGVVNNVLPQNWLFLTTYKTFREKLLRGHTLNLIARLGPKGFSTPMWDFNVQLLSLSHSQSTRDKLGSIKQEEWEHLINGLDVSEYRSPHEKSGGLLGDEIKQVLQLKQLENPDARIALEENTDLPLLSKYADALVGLQTSDDPMFLSAFFEHDSINKNIWEYLQGTPDIFKNFSGQSWLVRWENGEGLLLSTPTAYPTKGLKALGRPGIAINRMGKLFAYRYAKERFHQNVATIIPNDPKHLSAIWCFCSSSEYREYIRHIDQSLKVTNATLAKVPFDLERWTKVAIEKYPNGLPKPYSEDPTQWIFHGRPEKSDDPLQAVIARLLGYRWPTELDPDMELSGEAQELVAKCDDLLSFVDEDGIACIPAVRGEDPAADRVRELLAAAFGSEWSPIKEKELITATGTNANDLEDWLHNHFFDQHCKLFHHRPFVWHIWDGRKRDGFHALVSYHKLAEGSGKGKKLLETLTYSYLGDWIARQKDEVKRGVAGSDDRLTAAMELEKKLKAIIEGETPNDIFIRWKPIEEQPVGWEPDINDGVRLNIRPFMSDDIPNGKKGAGILRGKPNIKWTKDRGKDVVSSPWFSIFEGERINDHHLTLDEKQSARKGGGK